MERRREISGVGEIAEYPYVVGYFNVPEDGDWNIIGDITWHTFIHKITVDGTNVYEYDEYLTSGTVTIPDSVKTKGEHTVKIYLYEVDVYGDSFMGYMRLFNGCSYLTGVDFTNSLPCGSIYYMFNDCISLQEADLTGIIFDGFSDMDSLFSGCTNLTKVIMPMEPLLNGYSPQNMFANVTTTGTLYYNPDYDYSLVIENLPSTWTAIALDF